MSMGTFAYRLQHTAVSSDEVRREILQCADNEVSLLFHLMRFFQRV